MSYPPRAPMPYMNASIPPPHLIPPPRSYRNSATISSQPTVYHRPPEPQPQFRGPFITVFVGNISERVPETLLKRILAACGVVINWKRVSTFGFCEFDGPIAAMRAVRLLSELEIDGKKLVAKVDAKNKVLIEDYKEKECKNGGGGPNAMDEKTEDEYATNQMHDLLEEHKHEFDGFDATNRSDLYGSNTTNRKKTRRGEEDIKIKTLNDNALEEEKRNLISSEIGKFRKRAEADEHRKELEKEKEKEKQLASKEKEKERERDRERKKQRESERKNSSGSKSSAAAAAAATAAAPSTSNSSNNNNTNTSNNSNNNNAGSEVEEVVVINDKEPSKEPTSSRSRKESVVTIDASPVRKDHNKDHKEVHKDHKERSDNNKESRRRRSKSRTKERDREREREREREMMRDREVRDKERERERDRERDRERERVEMRERDREREREEKIVKPVRDARREKEMEEEQRERKKADKKAREKEAAYQNRLSNWEIREKRKTKENDKYRTKKSMRQAELEKDAKGLKEFVEDYDDERDDTLYYRGRELQQRLAGREREIEADTKDREKEADELVELKNKFFSGAYENPSQEFEKARKNLEKQYEPRIIINVNLEAEQRRKQETALSQKQQQQPKNQQHQQREDHDRRKHQKLGDAFDSLDNGSLSVVAGGSGVHKAPPSEDSMSTNDDRASMADTASNASGYSHLKTSSNNNISNNNNQQGDSVSRQNSESRDSLSNILTPTQSAMESEHATSGVSAFASASATGTSSSISMPIISLKKKMIETTGVFVNDDDNDDTINPKKRKLVPLDYDDNLSNSATNVSAPQTAAERQSSAVSAATAAAAAVSQKIALASGGGGAGSTSSGSASGKASAGKHGGSGSSSSGGKHGKNDSAATAGSAEAGGSGANTKKDENGAKVQDEKRRHIKNIIDRIPTQKDELFSYELDRNEIDGGLMERKIRPWINKKIIEYIGEPEPTLVDFICSKVLAGSPPENILNDVQMVLDEEAEVFVVKMWRLLIYELDAKKSGIAGK